MTQKIPFIKSGYRYGFHKPEVSVFKTPKGLSKEVVEAISYYKKEPDWMRNFRLQSLITFEQKQVPTWGADLSGINFDELLYYISPSEKKFHTWKNVPKDIKDTYEKIGIPQAERTFLAGVGTQWDSEVIYHNLKKEWESQGVIFVDTDTAVQKYPDIVQKYFGTIIPAADNKFAALNSAVWSGGSFIYIPKNVHVQIPLQAYFRINAANMGQFERTLIIADEGSYIHYVEGCSAPIYTTDSLHAAVVEIIVKKGARVRYTTIQNWSNNVYNLVTKRMLVEEEGFGEWIDSNLGAKVTMKYPSVILS
jgi:Fe-S cluster assembly protein SufB